MIKPTFTFDEATAILAWAEYAAWEHADDEATPSVADTTQAMLNRAINLVANVLPKPESETQ
jgi:hypothetical protein